MFAQMVRLESAARMSMGDYAVARKPLAAPRRAYGMWAVATLVAMVALIALVIAY